MEQPLLSIIIPVYNSEKTISRAIISVLEQASVELELILVNDGSTDESLHLMKRFTEMDSRIKLFTRQNEGVSSARNFGIQQAKGKYITFLDADDYYIENGLEKIMKDVNENTQLVIYGYDIVYENKTIECSPPFKSCLQFSEYDDFREYCLLLIENEIINAPWNKVYLAEFLREHNILFPPELDMGEDLKFNLGVLRDVQYVNVIPQPIVNYTVNKGAGLVSKFRGNRLELRYNLMVELKNLISYWRKLDKTEAVIDSMLIRDIMAFFMDFFKSNCDYTRTEKRKMAKTVLRHDVIKQILAKQHQYDLATRLIKGILVTSNSSLILIAAKILNLGRRFR
ncbi:glycosyltransferase family 2 protein [Bacillus marasmi]|uniref:glycosyltransferase family 2 protein n=1 Tax=Bacillus marasmi TaxID=1926279 RepID=UPI0011C95D2E|nr:glycosyltransferase family 2 protein [Bacillus marasmi]